jgi:hypothetical protein
MRPHAAGPKSSHLSGFYGSFECLKSISDIQCPIRKPITMPTASVPKLAFSSYQLGCLAIADFQELFERLNGLSPKLVV